MPFVIKFDNDTFNKGLGNEVPMHEADFYPTLNEAGFYADLLDGVVAILEVDHALVS